MGISLVYRSQPYPDEGLQGFILRLAEGNHVTPQRRLWGDASPNLDTLVGLLGIKEAPWSERLFRQSDNKGNRPLWNSRTRRYCPECLKDKPYWRQEWELSLMTVCPHHECSLIEVCAACDHLLTWRRSALLICPCGYDLRRAAIKHAEEKESRLAQMFANKLHGEDSDITYLQPLDLKQFHSLIITLGVYANPETRPALRDQKIDSLKESQPLVNTAAAVLLNWPNGFYQMLHRIQKSYSATESVGLGKRFGRFYSYLYEHYKNPEYGFLLHAFESYLEKNWRYALAGRNKRLSGRLRNKHIWVPAITIAKGFGVGLKQIISMTESGEIESSQVKTTKGRIVLCINRQQLDLIRGLLKDRVDLKLAATILGIQEARLRQLLEHHLLGRVLSPGENGNGRWRISRSALENILILGSDLPEWCTSENSEENDLEHALRYWLHKRYLFPRLIIAVIKEEILPIAINKNNTGLKAWVFDSASLRQWISDQIRGKRNGAITIPEAAKYLKIKQEVAYHLVKIGLLRVIIEQDSLHRLIEWPALDEFKQTYVLGVEISRRLKVSPKSLAEMLKKENVLPVSGNWIDGGRQNIYRRGSALDDALNILVGASASKT